MHAPFVFFGESGQHNRFLLDDDDVYYYTGERIKLEGETENKGVCTKEWERHDSRGTHSTREHEKGDNRGHSLP